MPRYFFDIDDGEMHFRDDDGQELNDLRAARDEAVVVLPAIARDVLPNGDRRDFVASIRDEENRVVFRATLSLVVEWIERADPS